MIGSSCFWAQVKKVFTGLALGFNFPEHVSKQMSAPCHSCAPHAPTCSIATCRKTRYRLLVFKSTEIRLIFLHANNYQSDKNLLHWLDKNLLHWSHSSGFSVSLLFSYFFVFHACKVSISMCFHIVKLSSRRNCSAYSFFIFKKPSFQAVVVLWSVDIFKSSIVHASLSSAGERR